ncbi:MAG: hypothetical protein ABI885_07565 [Gammaproteobacteria bacterium]
MSEKPPEHPTPDEHLDERLDEALNETFPASDPIAVHEPRRPPPRTATEAVTKSGAEPTPKR